MCTTSIPYRDRFESHQMLHLQSRSLLMNQGKQRKMAQELGPLHPHRRPGWGSWLLVSAWLSSSLRSHLWRKLALADLSLCLSIFNSAFQIIKMNCKMFVTPR